MSMLMPPTSTSPERLEPPKPGDKWVCVTARGQGLPVKIQKVTALNVMFKAFGRNVEEGLETLALDAFMIRYRPMDRVKTRQAELRLREKREGLPCPDVSTGPVEVSPPPTLTGAPSAPATSPPGEKWRRPPGSYIKKKLTEQQAREVCTLARDWIPYAEIAATYSIDASTVSRIWTGDNWGHATADIRATARPPRPVALGAAAPPPQPPAPVATATPDPEEEPAVHTRPTPPYDRIQPPRFAGSGFGQPVKDGVHLAMTPDPVSRTLPEIRALLVEMADALEILVEYAGKPLPKYVKLDLDAIRGLVEQARILS